MCQDWSVATRYQLRPREYIWKTDAGGGVEAPVPSLVHKKEHADKTTIPIILGHNWLRKMVASNWG